MYDPDLDRSAAEYHQQCLEREQEAILKYRDTTTEQLWMLYNAIMAGQWDEDEHAILSVLHYREGYL